MEFSKEMLGQIIDIVEDFVAEYTCSDDETVITGKDYDKLSTKFTELLKNWVPDIIKNNLAVPTGYLYDWYQASLADPNAKPVWSDEHIKEVSNDFYLIPKETVDGPEDETESEVK